MADSGAHALDIEIVNKRGLHARASAKFVKTVEEFDVDITVCKDGTCVGGQSIMGLMLLAAAKGDQITLKSEGAEAGPALQALEQLIADKFGEDE